MFGTNGVSTASVPSAYIRYGIQNVKVNDFEVAVALSGSKRIVANIESKPIEVEGFKADKVATNGGQIGRVAFSSWIKDGSPHAAKVIEDINKDMGILGDKLGVRKAVDAIKSDSLEDFVEQLNNVLCGEFFWLAITAEEYQKKDAEPGARPGITLSKRRFGFANSEALEAGDDENKRLKPFDKSNRFDYKVLEVMDAPVADSAPEATADTPF